MANAGGGADFVSTTRGIIFGPAAANAMEQKSWGNTLRQLLDIVYPKGGATMPDLQTVAGTIADAIRFGALPPAPVFKAYKGHDSLTTDVKDTDDTKIGGSIGATLSFVSLSATYDHESGTQAANQQNHYLEYEVETPIPDGDRIEGAARFWLLIRQAELAGQPVSGMLGDAPPAAA